jgi:hypothetical protein
VAGGGGVDVGNNSTANFSACTIVGNSSYSWGGGLLVSGNGGRATLSGCTISDNTNSSIWGGGGVSGNAQNFSIMMSDCLIQGNSGGVGGVYIQASASTVTNSVICGNSPSQYFGWGNTSGNCIEDSCTICFPPCPADIDSSGSVDGVDLGDLLANWGTPVGADLDHNGSVDGADLGILLAAWGPCPN